MVLPVAAATALLLHFWTAQEPLEADIRVDVRLVRIPCTVTDKKGVPAKTLTAKDFSIRDNGEPRSVRYFARDTDLPLTVGLVVDVSGSQRQFLSRHRRALGQFFQQILRPGDRVFIVALSRDVRLIQDFTGSVEELDAAIGRVQPNGGVRIGTPCPTREIHVRNRVIHISTCGGSVIWDGIYYAAEKLRNEDGRKALIVMTDGEDSGSPHSLDQALGMAQAAETILYPIKTVTRRKLKDALRKPLETLAEHTGGLAFDGSKQKDSTAIFARIQDELRTLYMLGFHAEDNPKEKGSPPKFRELKVGVPRGYKVRTRSGYWTLGTPGTSE